MKLSTSRLGHEHPVTLLVMHELAVVWKAMKLNTESISLIRACVYRSIRAYGLTSTETHVSVRIMTTWEAEARAAAPSSSSTENTGLKATRCRLLVAVK